MKQEKDRRMCFFCGLTAVLMLTVCTKSSFLYPINDWVDANIFFTMGKAMMRGRVLYRDIYDHKGPLLYLLHGIASLISMRTFLGVYFLEILSFTAFLAAVWKIVELYSHKGAFAAVIVLAACILSSDSFCHGDSAEEFCLPLIMWSFYASLRYFKAEYPAPMGYWTLFGHGILAGCILWIKYTMLGFHFAWMMMVFVSCMIRRDWKRSVFSCLVFLGGMFVTAIPWLLYFGWNGALFNLWDVYVYDNIFRYASKEPVQWLHVIKSTIKNVMDAFAANWKYSLFIVGGGLWFFVSGKQRLLEKVNLAALAFFTAMGVCWGVVQWQPYYALVFSVFSVLGFAAVFSVTEKRLSFLEKRRGLIGSALLILGLVFCFLTGNYTDQIGRKKEDTVQYQFASYIGETEGASILNYGFQDGGFYTVCGITPQFKYFSRINMQLPEFYEEQEGLIRDGRVDYVITRGFVLEGEQLAHYQEIVSQSSVYEGIVYEYHLYKRK